MIFLNNGLTTEERSKISRDFLSRAEVTPFSSFFSRVADKEHDSDNLAAPQSDTDEVEKKELNAWAANYFDSAGESQRNIPLTVPLTEHQIRRLLVLLADQRIKDFFDITKVLINNLPR